MKSDLRKVGIMEGVSLLVLLGIAMPLKYMMEMPQAVRIVGMLHGALFIFYILLAILVSKQEKWPMSRLLMAMILSCLPFGTFIFDKMHLAEPVQK